MAGFLEKPAGKFAAGAVAIVGIVGMAYTAFTMFTSSPAAQLAKQTFVDSTTGLSFSHTVTPGELPPVQAPSGGRTGYPPELCYWTADGKPKDQPDYVLLNEEVGKPGPTFCPVCHRLVVHHNPSATSGARVPPTQAEYEQSHG